MRHTGLQTLPLLSSMISHRAVVRTSAPLLRAANSAAAAPADDQGGRPRAAAGVTVGYVTDCEGDLAFWSRYCDLSSVLVRDSEGRVDLADGECHFVFGGDSVDKGGRDLAFLRDLVGLKERHPGRVHLVLGNRDINKMRFAAELAPQNWAAAEELPQLV